jgi:hypothetical protein
MERKFECSIIEILAQIAKDMLTVQVMYLNNVFTEYERDNGDNFGALV